MTPDLRSRLACDDGISLVEVLVAMVVLVVAVLGLASAATSSLISLQDSRTRQRAAALATESLEFARSYDYSDVAMRTGDPLVPAGGQFSPNDGTANNPGSGEAIVQAAIGAVTGNSHNRSAEGLTLRTFVTQPSDPALRRVTVVVEWTGRGSRREVRYSTLVSDASRGLAQPDFDVLPPVRELRVTRGQDACMMHTLTNSGASDRFAVILPDRLPDPPAALAGYTVGVFIDSDADGIGDPGEAVTGRDAANNPLTGPLATGQQWRLLLCYDPASSSSESLSTNVVVRSALDPNKQQALAHKVVVEAKRSLHLTAGSGQGDRVRDLGELLLLGDGTPTTVTLHNYDTAVGSEPGLRLPAGDVARDIAWQYQFDLARTLTANSTLTLWAAAADVTVDQTADLRVTVTLERLGADGTSLATLVAPQTFNLPAASQQWQPYAIVLTHGQVQMAASEQLRLKVGCEAASTRDCRLAYDTSAFPANLEVRFP